MACLNEDTKHLIISNIEQQVDDTDKALVLAEFIESLPRCTTEELPKGRKGKRPLSQYNIFLSTCLKHDKMDTCVPKWRVIKECIRNGGNFEGCKSTVYESTVY